MKYLYTLLFAFLISFGLPFLSNADNSVIGIPEITDFENEECTLTVKESSFWSFKSTEKEITGPCEELVNLM